jgi:hypothetical protein
MLIKNAAGRVVAVDSRRAKVLLREGYTPATAEEARAWQIKNTRQGRAQANATNAVASRPSASTPEPEPERAPEPPPEEFTEESLRAYTKAELVELAADRYSLELDADDLKATLIEAILEAAGA